MANLSLLHFADCDFCGQVKWIKGTPHGCYCTDCMRIMIDEFTEAIEDIEKQEEEWDN